MKRSAMYPFALAAFTAIIFSACAPTLEADDSATATDDMAGRIGNKTNAATTHLKADDGVVTKARVYATELTDDDISLEVHDGVARLTGTVCKESHKELARNAVANLPGVLRVDNQLKLNTADAANTPTPAERIASENGNDASAAATNTVERPLATKHVTDIKSVTSAEKPMTANQTIMK